MLITRFCKVGGAANICRDVPAAKKTRRDARPAGGKRLACFPPPILRQRRPDSEMRPRVDDRLQLAFGPALSRIYSVAHTR